MTDSIEVFEVDNREFQYLDDNLNIELPISYNDHMDTHELAANQLRYMLLIDAFLIGMYKPNESQFDLMCLFLKSENNTSVYLKVLSAKNYFEQKEELVDRQVISNMNTMSLSDMKEFITSNISASVGIYNLESIYNDIEVVYKRMEFLNLWEKENQ